jgi:hypothetical protein
MSSLNFDGALSRATGPRIVDRRHFQDGAQVVKYELDAN